GADVIVTMGRSVGYVEIPPTVRHVDWRVGDPAGAPIDEVRRVREDIERRVEALASELLESQPASVAAQAPQTERRSPAAASGIGRATRAGRLTGRGCARRPSVPARPGAAERASGSLRTRGARGRRRRSAVAPRA